MATSLARQLKSIRSDITATLDKRKFEKVSSLLFEPDEAAVQDFDTILALGQNGLHGLIQIDSRFQKFEKTLFSETAKGIDRAIQVCSALLVSCFD
jgi:U3 small nucleolar RNA-associated protein 10